MNLYEAIALILAILAFILLSSSFWLSLDSYVNEYAHDITKGLGDPSNYWYPIKRLN